VVKTISPTEFRIQETWVKVQGWAVIVVAVVWPPVIAYWFWNMSSDFDTLGPVVMGFLTAITVVIFALCLAALGMLGVGILRGIIEPLTPALMFGVAVSHLVFSPMLFYLYAALYDPQNPQKILLVSGEILAGSGIYCATVAFYCYRQTGKWD
jgi:hypothetical protein